MHSGKKAILSIQTIQSVELTDEVLVTINTYKQRNAMRATAARRLLILPWHRQKFIPYCRKRTLPGTTVTASVHCFGTRIYTEVSYILTLKQKQTMYHVAQIESPR